ncbi:hypothetical protein JYQ62_11255 [Nostoc sp. UHCC 0702]|nr:hypothetical protein JYQ62_11255 [Nostoc sp. UHCC 0702]
MSFYKVYDLNIRSDFPLPELLQGENKTDIYIQKGKLNPPKLEPTSIQRQGIEALFGGHINEAYLKWPGVATLLAKDGNTLIVDPDSDEIDPQLLNLYILSEALGLILYQRGFFLLHASAVKIGEQVIIFAGCPGAGKSTTAAAFAQCGYTVLGDDMVAISLNSTGKAMVYPGFPQIKIWPATVKGLGYNQSKLPPLFSGSRKRVIQNQENFPDKPFPLAHIFIVEDGAEFKITKMLGTEAFFAFARFFPLPSELLQGVAREQHFQECIQLANQANIWKLENPKYFRVLKQLITWVERELERENEQEIKLKQSLI